MIDGWIGVDLDGTLAIDEDGPLDKIGPPVPAMLERVKRWLDEGKEVRIVTARVAGIWSSDTAEQRVLISAWCLEHVGKRLPVTASKDNRMAELWDDRAVQVIRNTGERVGNVERKSSRRRDRVSGCATCEECLPPHDASANCESGGHNHCSCDICF